MFVTRLTLLEIYIRFCYTVGVPCYENKTICHVYNCLLYFIQYYNILHFIDPALKINVSKLFVFDFLFVVDVSHIFYLQSIYFLSSKF